METGQEGSFSERYGRLTPDGSDPPSPTPPERGGSGRLVVVVLGLVLLVVAATVGVLALQGPGYADRRSLPEPVPAGHLPSPKPTTAPGAKKTEAQRVTEAFVARMAKPNLGFYLDCDVRAAFGTERLTVRGQMKVRGEDYSTTLVVGYGGRKVPVSLVSKNARVYVKVPGRPWQRLPSYERLDAANPFADGTEEVQYTGVARKDGQRLHRFRLPDWATNPAGLTHLKALGIKVRRATADVFVRSDGTPVLATFILEGRARGETTRMRARGDYRFSRFGPPVRIVAPKDFD